ncbi:integrin alpha-4-like [Littorina saxatilis]|uniref:integrin alpha-4-like n=1 Tax=Littorina saxatilis TaxID=31220 RepID=UPI0038B5DA33
MTSQRSIVHLGWTKKLTAVMVLWSAVFLLTLVDSFNVDTSKPIIYKGPSGSYFGYSVAMLENKKGGWILVGAPRAEDAFLANGTIQQPGALFQCNWQYRSSCRPVIIDQTGNEKQVIPKHKNITVLNKKDFQWLGATVDVNYYGNENVVVCAPRWKDAEHEIQGHIFMNGMCYESSKELDFNPSSPWPVLDNLRMQIHTHGHLVYGMGSVGTSAQYSKDGSFLLFGAPGLNDWTGGYVRVSGGLQSRPKIFEPPRALHNNSYIGYSITTAQLTTDAVHTIVGGPRGNNSGKVIGYSHKFDVVLVKEGEQFGSYFGAALCAADLNGDNLDDLLVGAPMYSEQYDEGRVYVYINKEFFNLDFLAPALSGSNTPGARFGSTIVNMRDINNDGFHDVAIGAPYEATTGVVYIYNGAKTGLYLKFSQRIVGSDIDPGLRAFGYAISRSWDIDGNYYADIVVGAYGSDRAVLLRTRSVLDLQARFTISPSKVSHAKPACVYKGRGTPCLKATVCFKYSGINLPPATEVKMTLRLDTLERHRGERTRMFLVLSDGPNTGEEVEETSVVEELRQDLWSCLKTYTIYVRESRDVITPLQLELDYDIPPNVPGISMGCDICPIRNIYSPTKETRQVIYMKDCGPDSVCMAELQINATPIFGTDADQTQLLIDDSPMFEMDVHINNTGELAYLTYVVMNYPDTIKFSRARLLQGNSAVSCIPAKSPNTSASLECDLSSPVVAGVDVVFRVRFYAAALPFNMKSFNISLEVKTASDEAADRLGDNFVNVTIPVEIRSLVNIHSISIPGQLGTPRALLPNNRTELRLIHLYTLHNQGPSPFPHGQLTITLPHTPFVWLSNVQAKSRNSADNIALDCEVSSDTNNLRKQKEETEISDDEREKSAQQSAYTSSDLVCRPGQCTTVRCYVGLLHKDQALLISLNITVKQDILHKMKVGRQLRIISQATFQEPDLPSYVSISADKNANATTFIVYKLHYRPAFAWWVLGVSIVSGFLLLYILIVLLWKFGFFRRKRREELQKLIETSSTHPEELEALHPPSSGSSPEPFSTPPPPFSSLSDDNDVMVLPPSNSFFPDQSQHTLILRNNNNNASNDFNDVQSHTHSLGGRQHQRGGGGVGGGSLGRSRGQQHHVQHWTPPPPPPLPAFNNQLYLEPLEHTV